MADTTVLSQPVETSERRAPGHPGGEPRWATGAKWGVGTALSPVSRVWFTIANGAVDEVYFPKIDHANTRKLSLVVTDGAEYFSDETQDARHEIHPLAIGVPGYRLINTCRDHRYRIVKTVITDPGRDALLQRIEFEPKESGSDLRLFVLLTPHLDNHGYGNSGSVGDYKGVPMLFAERPPAALALACSVPFQSMTCGYVETSDPLQDLRQNKRFTRTYAEAPDGDICLGAEIDVRHNGQFKMVLAFGEDRATAGQQARAALLLEDFERPLRQYVAGWQEYQKSCYDPGRTIRETGGLYWLSTAVMRTHEAKRLPGGLIASLAIPWGFKAEEGKIGGYHLLWPRDQVEGALGLLAAGDAESARRVLAFMIVTQEADGHWPQNMWLNGVPYFSGIQMDGGALAILLADALHRVKGLGDIDPWPAMRKAAGYLVRHGPCTRQDRWEENQGYTPFTMAAEVAALLAAADMADRRNESRVAGYLRETADVWNEMVELTYATGTHLARQLGIDGYYVRIAPPQVLETPLSDLQVRITSRPQGEDTFPATDIVSPDALALVRFGLRSPKDPRMLNTVKAIDATVRAQVSTGPIWHRYSHDGYGEHEDGSPFNEQGIGRGWPLLAGERAHYEIAAGNMREAERLRATMEAQTGPGGLLPEQVWDTEDIPERGLQNGRPSGSAMPLVWAHSEYVRLVRSLETGKVWDMPPQTVERYQKDRKKALCRIWRPDQRIRHIPSGRKLRIELPYPGVVHWSDNDWKTTHDTQTTDSGLGTYYADLAPAKASSKLIFTLFRPDQKEWERRNHEVLVG